MSGKRGGLPTLRRRRLGAELRRYRDLAGLTIDAVAATLGCSASKISRIENGQTGASPRDVRDMLVLFGVAEPELEELLEVARQTRERGWWQQYGAVLTSAFVGFEAAARSIRCYEAQCVPGLLQTEEYAHALFLRADLSSAEIDRRIQVRMERQALLTQDDPVRLWCVIDEAALRRPVGGGEVMRRQLDYLTQAAGLAHVTLQVLPLSAGAHAAMDGSFVMLHFPDDADADTVYVTMATGGVFQEKSDEIRRYDVIFDNLIDLALPAEESVGFLTNLAKELTT